MTVSNDHNPKAYDSAVAYIDHSTELRLGRWIRMQKDQFMKNALRKDRVEKLMSIGMAFNKL